MVGTAVEGLPVTLGEGRGLLVPPEDPEALAAALGAVLDGSARTDIAGGKRYAATFDAARIAGEYFSVYQDALDRTHRHLGSTVRQS